MLSLIEIVVRRGISFGNTIDHLTVAVSRIDPELFVSLYFAGIYLERDDFWKSMEDALRSVMRGKGLKFGSIHDKQKHNMQVLNSSTLFEVDGGIDYINIGLSGRASCMLGIILKGKSLARGICVSETVAAPPSRLKVGQSIFLRLQVETRRQEMSDREVDSISEDSFATDKLIYIAESNLEKSVFGDMVMLLQDAPYHAISFWDGNYVFEGILGVNGGVIKFPVMNMFTRYENQSKVQREMLSWCTPYLRQANSMTGDDNTKFINQISTFHKHWREILHLTDRFLIMPPLQARNQNPLLNQMTVFSSSFCVEQHREFIRQTLADGTSAMIQCLINALQTKGVELAFMQHMFQGQLITSLEYCGLMKNYVGVEILLRSIAQLHLNSSKPSSCTTAKEIFEHFPFYRYHQSMGPQFNPILMTSQLQQALQLDYNCACRRFEAMIGSVKSILISHASSSKSELDVDIVFGHLQNLVCLSHLLRDFEDPWECLGQYLQTRFTHQNNLYGTMLECGSSVDQSLRNFVDCICFSPFTFVYHVAEKVYFSTANISNQLSILAAKEVTVAGNMQDVCESWYISLHLCFETVICLHIIDTYNLMKSVFLIDDSKRKESLSGWIDEETDAGNVDSSNNQMEWINGVDKVLYEVKLLLVHLVT